MRFLFILEDAQVNWQKAYDDGKLEIILLNYFYCMS